MYPRLVRYFLRIEGNCGAGLCVGVFAGIRERIFGCVREVSSFPLDDEVV